MITSVFSEDSSRAFACFFAAEAEVHMCILCHRGRFIPLATLYDFTFEAQWD